MTVPLLITGRRRSCRSHRSWVWGAEEVVAELVGDDHEVPVARLLGHGNWTSPSMFALTPKAKEGCRLTTEVGDPAAEARAGDEVSQAGAGRDVAEPGSAELVQHIDGAAAAVGGAPGVGWVRSRTAGTGR